MRDDCIPGRETLANILDSTGARYAPPMMEAARCDGLIRDFFDGRCPPNLKRCRDCPAARDWAPTLESELGWCRVFAGHVTAEGAPRAIEPERVA